MCNDEETSQGSEVQQSQLPAPVRVARGTNESHEDAGVIEATMRTGACVTLHAPVSGEEPTKSGEARLLEPLSTGSGYPLGCPLGQEATLFPCCLLDPLRNCCSNWPEVYYAVSPKAIEKGGCFWQCKLSPRPERGCFWQCTVSRMPQTQGWFALQQLMSDETNLENHMRFRGHLAHLECVLPRSSQAGAHQHGTHCGGGTPLTVSTVDHHGPRLPGLCPEFGSGLQLLCSGGHRIPGLEQEVVGRAIHATLGKLTSQIYDACPLAFLAKCTTVQTVGVRVGSSSTVWVEEKSVALSFRFQAQEWRHINANTALQGFV